MDHIAAAEERIVTERVQQKLHQVNIAAKEHLYPLQDHVNFTLQVLQQLNVFADEDIVAAAEALNDMPIKKLYMLLEMAAQGKSGGASEAIYSGNEKIRMSHFYDCLQDVVRY